MDGILFTLLAMVLFVVVLGGIVLIHELGHYLTARAFDVRVLEFGFGFPPRAKVLRSRGETLFTLNWLPLGGFVRMDGEDGDAPDDPRSFSAKSLRIRLAILVAGVAMNIVLAFAIFFSLALLAWPVVGVKIGEVETGSPAAAAGLQAGDQILQVNGEGYELASDRTVIDGLHDNAGKTVTLSIVRADGTRTTAQATLRAAADTSPTRGALGVSKLEQTFSGDYVGHDLGTAVGMAGTQLTTWGGLILNGLGQVVGGFITNPTAPPAAQGPIGIAVSLADYLLGSGPILLLFIAGILSVNLGVVNILPFPPLDGGRMAMLIIKRIFGARVSLRAERLTYAVGFVFLLVFVFWISGFDIANLGNR
ncbi:MAG TPA: M50 family metallopeptidase [Candidatus Limnocylindrales bacterium]|nr:M50 family metallopeptidase [Candidatus Limnocylindrales bacterium]